MTDDEKKLRDEAAIKYVSNINFWGSKDHITTFIAGADWQANLLRDQINELTEQVDFLNALRACGVDNWEGYSDAIDMMNEDADE